MSIEMIKPASHINLQSFEAELGLLCHKWLILKPLDHVIEGLDLQVHALEIRRDLPKMILQPSAQS